MYKVLKILKNYYKHHSGEIFTLVLVKTDIKSLVPILYYYEEGGLGILVYSPERAFGGIWNNSFSGRSSLVLDVSGTMDKVGESQHGFFPF